MNFTRAIKKLSIMLIGIVLLGIIINVFESNIIFGMLVLIISILLLAVYLLMEKEKMLDIKKENIRAKMEIVQKYDNIRIQNEELKMEINGLKDKNEKLEKKAKKFANMAMRMVTNQRIKNRRR